MFDLWIRHPRMQLVQPWSPGWTAPSKWVELGHGLCQLPRWKTLVEQDEVPGELQPGNESRPPLMLVLVLVVARVATGALTEAVTEAVSAVLLVYDLAVAV